jgi:hypothetical protein
MPVRVLAPHSSSMKEIDGLETVWNVGSFDDEGELKKLDPYDLSWCNNAL